MTKEFHFCKNVEAPTLVHRSMQSCIAVSLPSARDRITILFDSPSNQVRHDGGYPGNMESDDQMLGLIFPPIFHKTVVEVSSKLAAKVSAKLSIKMPAECSMHFLSTCFELLDFSAS